MLLFIVHAAFSSLFVIAVLSDIDVSLGIDEAALEVLLVTFPGAFVYRAVEVDHLSLAFAHEELVLAVVYVSVGVI